jgi:hypothetical protein
LSLSFIPQDSQIRLARKKLSQRFSFIWSSLCFPPTSPPEHQEHCDLLGIDHVWRFWRPAQIIVAARDLDLFQKSFDTFLFFSSGCFKYTSNELNKYLQLIHHKKYVKITAFILKNQKTCFETRSRGSGVIWWIWWSPAHVSQRRMSVIYGPPAECQTQLHSLLYYTHSLKDKHPRSSTAAVIFHVVIQDTTEAIPKIPRVCAVQYQRSANPPLTLRARWCAPS